MDHTIRLYTHYDRILWTTNHGCTLTHITTVPCGPHITAVFLHTLRPYLEGHTSRLYTYVWYVRTTHHGFTLTRRQTILIPCCWTSSQSMQCWDSHCSRGRSLRTSSHTDPWLGGAGKIWRLELHAWVWSCVWVQTKFAHANSLCYVLVWHLPCSRLATNSFLTTQCAQINGIREDVVRERYGETNCNGLQRVV